MSFAITTQKFKFSFDFFYKINKFYVDVVIIFVMMLN